MLASPDTKATVLISGEGSNLQSLIDASLGEGATMPYLKIIRVISNKATANGLNRAKNASIPTEYHNLVKHGYQKPGERDPAVKQAAREKYDAKLAQIVLKDETDMVICAGWMHILAPTFLDPLAEKGVPVINLHPALPGMYDGINAIERAYDDFQKGKLLDNTTGIMIHYVISEVDRGEPIAIKKIECKPDETLDQLKERIHGEEHKLILEGTRKAIDKLWEKRAQSGLYKNLLSWYQ